MYKHVPLQKKTIHKLLFFLKKIGAIILVMFGISLISFLLMRLTNGNPASIILGLDGAKGSKEAIAFLESELGLDLPIYQQYLHWVSSIIKADFGNSYFSGTPVLNEILSRLPKTLYLSVVALLISLGISIPVAYFLSVSHNIIAKVIKFIIIVLGCMPSFWVALVLLYLASVKFHLLPVIYSDNIISMILPAIVLSLNLMPEYVLLFEDSFSQIIKKEYILSAQIKSVSKRGLFFMHILRNALIPTITLIGHNFVGLLAGSFIVESIFGYPGIGKYAIDAILHKDYPVVQGYIVIFAVIVVIINIIVDFIYHYIDPTLETSYDRAS